MGYPTEMQFRRGRKTDQWYVTIPHPVAEAMELEWGEVWGWIVEDKDQMVLRRQIPSESGLQKTNRRRAFSGIFRASERRNGTAAMTRTRRPREADIFCCTLGSVRT